MGNHGPRGDLVFFIAPVVVDPVTRRFVRFAVIGLVGLTLALPAAARIKHEFHNTTFELVDRTGGTAKGSYHLSNASRCRRPAMVR